MKGKQVRKTLKTWGSHFYTILTDISLVQKDLVKIGKAGTPYAPVCAKGYVNVEEGAEKQGVPEHQQGAGEGEALQEGGGQGDEGKGSVPGATADSVKMCLSTPSSQEFQSLASLMSCNYHLS